MVQPMENDKPPAKRGPGRPPLDPTGKQKPVSVKITDRERDALRAKYGSVNKGVRALVEAEFPAEKRDVL